MIAVGKKYANKNGAILLARDVKNKKINLLASGRRVSFTKTERQSTRSYRR